METFVPASIKDLTILLPGELCRVRLALPEAMDVDGVSFSLADHMRPGTAFLAKPWGVRTQKVRRRMYTRSNIAAEQPGCLETYINYTHREASDSSLWWLSDEAAAWMQAQKPIDVRVELDPEQRMARIYENTQNCAPTNLRLEADGQWETMSMVCVGLGTGITPFLAYARHWIRHRAAHGDPAAGSLTLIVSAPHAAFLICHEELQEMQSACPAQFSYVPILTDSWPDEWQGGRGEIVRTHQGADGQAQVDLSPLLSLAPDLTSCHMRLCGQRPMCRQISQGLEQLGITPLSMRSESW